MASHPALNSEAVYLKPSYHFGSGQCARQSFGRSLTDFTTATVIIIIGTTTITANIPIDTIAAATITRVRGLGRSSLDVRRQDPGQDAL